MDDNGILLAEWKEIRESLRYFGNKRFAQLTVFLAAEGATINAFLSPSEDLSRLVFQSAGLLLAVLFFVMELSSVTYWKDFAARGEEIETTLKLLKLMTKHRQSSGTDSATKATYFLYVSVALFWVSSFVWSMQIHASAVVDTSVSFVTQQYDITASDAQLRSLTYDSTKKTYTVEINNAQAANEEFTITVDGMSGNVLSATRTP